MINKKPSVKLNFLYNILYQVLTVITPLIVTPYVSRILHPEGIGIYGYAYATANYFVLFTMLGLNNYGNRMVARYRDDENKLSKVFWSIYGMQIVTSLICIFAYFIFVIFLNNGDIISWVMLLYVLSAGVDITWFFQGIEEFKLTVSRNAFIKIISSVSIFIFVKNENDLIIYSLIMVGSILISQLLLWPFLRKYVNKVKIGIFDIIIHFKPNIVLFIPAIAVSFYRVMDKIMLGMINGTLEVGYYESTDKLVSIPLCIVTALGTVMMPRMANIVLKKSKEEIVEIVTKSLSISILISAPMAIGMISVTDILVPIFYGPGYEKCIYLFYILLPSTLFISMANVIRTQILIPYGLDNVFVKSCIIGAICNVTINCILIPYYGSIGAAIGTLCTEIVVFLVQVIYAKKYIKLKSSYKFILFNLVSACIMGIIVYNVPIFIGHAVIQLGVKVLIGMLIYIFELIVYIKITNDKFANEIINFILPKHLRRI